ncbi:hypothetical protein [Methylomonas sp. 11b]|uniref:hypothetical protein n=1 Tax=Methylomonas sp. 11b TaxID=1168169 RepID=UPI00047CBD04|nr:hypothetical protein [Methylomonas sp. 11b]
MEPKWIAKINNQGDIGTAYPIGPNLLLTAGHVVQNVKWHDGGSVSVEWPDLKDSNNRSLTAVARNIAFDGKLLVDDKPINCDLVVLDCQLPKAIHQKSVSWMIFSQKFAEARTGWKAAGYPNVNSNNLETATGLFSADLEKPVIKLTLDDTIDPTVARANVMPNGWGGMSGAPVFDIASGKIQAVITEHNLWMEKQLVGVSIPWLIRNSATFRQILGIKTVGLPALNVHERICKHLEPMQKSMLFQTLVEQFLPPGLQALPENVVKELLKASEGNQIAFLEQFRLAVESSLEKDRQDAGVALNLFLLLLSLTDTGSFTATLSRQHDLPVRTRMAAEIYLASVYGLVPDLTLNKQKITDVKNAVVGRHAVESGFMREVGWQPDKNAAELAHVVNIAVNKVYRKLHSNEPDAPLDEFDLEELNHTLKTRRKGAKPELIRLEVDSSEDLAAMHPLHNPDVCKALNDCLSELPIVRYGKGVGNNEAHLRAQVNEFFRIIQKYMDDL